MEKTQFHRDIDAIVAQAINEDEEVVRVCGNCEEESGPQRIGPGQGKSHSYCKRHMIAMARNNGLPDLEQKYAGKPDDYFPPDLQRHPELVDHAGKEQWMRKRAADREAQQRELSMRQ